MKRITYKKKSNNNTTANDGFREFKNEMKIQYLKTGQNDHFL